MDQRRLCTDGGETESDRTFRSGDGPTFGSRSRRTGLPPPSSEFRTRARPMPPSRSPGWTRRAVAESSSRCTSVTVRIDESVDGIDLLTGEVCIAEKGDDGDDGDNSDDDGNDGDETDSWTHALAVDTAVVLESDTRAISITQEQLAPVLAGSFLANYWPTAEERYVTTPNELPRTYEGFRNAVFQIALHRATDTRIEAAVTGSPVGDRDLPSSLSGEVVDVRQSLVRPVTSTLPIENAFELEVDGDRYTIGGTGAFLEDYEAESVTIRPLEE